MDTEKAALVICLTLFIVIGVNAAIYVSVAHKGTIGQIDLMRRAARRARDPWGQETADLQELSRRVASLKGKDEEETEESE